jgi:hypothetical protein
VSDAELVALAVAQAAIGISSDRQFLGLIGRVLPGWFPHLPEQSQYNRRLRALVELISIVQQQLARSLDAGGVRLADGSQLAVASYPGCQQRSHFAGFARYGYSKSQHRFIWGVRLVLLTDERGLPLGYTLVPANEKEYEPLADLLTGIPAAVVVADKGFWGRDYRERLAATGTTLLTPDRTRTHANQQRERALASTRLVIESVFANLKARCDSNATSPRHQPARRPHRPTHPRPHTRDPAQHPRRQTGKGARGLRRPLNHIKSLVDVKRDHMEKMRSSDADEAPRPHGNYTVTRNGPQRDIAGRGVAPPDAGTPALAELCRPAQPAVVVSLLLMRRSSVVCGSARFLILVPRRFFCVGCSALAGRRRVGVWILTPCRSRRWSVCTPAS